MSPSLGHAAVMTFGFIPLFFTGFLFTAGPKWLGVDGPEARSLLAPLLLQAAGWLVWLLGLHTALGLSLAGGAVALLGLGCSAVPMPRGCWPTGAFPMRCRPVRLSPRRFGCVMRTGEPILGSCVWAPWRSLVMDSLTPRCTGPICMRCCWLPCKRTNSQNCV